MLIPPPRSGEGRGDEGGHNLYENFAEATSGKGSVLPDSGVNFAADAENMEREAEEEEVKDKEAHEEKGSGGTRSAPPEIEQIRENVEEVLTEVDGDGEGSEAKRSRASESSSGVVLVLGFRSVTYADLGPQ